MTSIEVCFISNVQEDYYLKTYISNDLMTFFPPVCLNMEKMLVCWTHCMEREKNHIG